MWRLSGYAYLAYPALAIGMARLLDPSFPPSIAREHDALVAAYERRLIDSATGVIETYPNEAFPTDVAAVAGAIAIHGRATGVDHTRVLAHWSERVFTRQIDPKSGLVIQRMGALDGTPHDAPRGSGTGLAAYFTGFASRAVAERLTESLLRHESTLAGFARGRQREAIAARLLFLFAMAHALLTLLGAASEASGLDRTLKSSTVKHRSHSLFWQGTFWYRQLAFMRDDWFERLITAFDKIVRDHEAFAQSFGIL